MLSKSELKKEWGFTERLIQELGQPDELAKNPHYRSAAPMQLYDTERVAKFVKQHTLEFSAVEAKRASRKAAAKKGIETKLARTLAWVENVEIKIVKPLPATFELLKSAADSHAFDRYGADARPTPVRSPTS